MSYNETGTRKKRKIAHQSVFGGTANAPFVPAHGLRAQGNLLSPHPRVQSTAVLARTTGKLLEHNASSIAKYEKSLAQGILPLLNKNKPATPLLQAKYQQH